MKELSTLMSNHGYEAQDGRNVTVTTHQSGPCLVEDEWVEVPSVRNAVNPDIDRSHMDDDDVVRRNLIDADYAQHLLSSYVTRVEYFPFVTIPPQPCLDSFRLERPFLLLSILATSSGERRALQENLDEHLRQVLARRVFLKYERSLDLLQGLLVYLTW